MRKALRRLGDRVYSDFLMGSRLDDYQRWLEGALEAGYQVRSVGATWQLIGEGGLDPAQRHLVLRHDVDTDPGTAAAMWDIERRLQISSSYFFRLSTLDPRLMTEIDAAGSEASYHYEELATIAKRRGLRTPEDLLDHLQEARDHFAGNIKRLRASTGLPMRVVAAHGDFVNRRLGIANWVVLSDPEFRRSVSIELETYDREYLDHLPRRYTDAAPPLHWEPSDPATAVREGETIISVLVHPRQWRANPMANARDDIWRVVEGLRFEFVPRLRARA
jgi:hypothetical protein